uniref:Uncharacterized protein n=1 Tax=Monopterus albus TaxID=43700 RepID=A0A3Q3IWX4_MONAL
VEVSLGKTLNPPVAPDAQDAPFNQIPEKMIGRELTEQGRFAFAALCGVSLGQLFTGPENSVFREQYLLGLVHWLDLDESVMPVMGAFLSGLGFEGSDTFLSILQAEPLLATGANPIIQDLVTFSVKDGQYDARARVLIRHVSCLLRVSPQQLEEFEETLGEQLREGGEESECMFFFFCISMCFLSFHLNFALFYLSVIFTHCLPGYKMKKCVGHLHLTIAVTGWLCSGKYSSFQAPWCSLGKCGEQYCLVWESHFLRELGSAMTSLLDGLISIVAQEALKYTVLSGMIMQKALWPLHLYPGEDEHYSGVMHLFSFVLSLQGKRPVNLIGFSLGARVIYYCLQELASDQGSEGVVEDVVLLGAPVDGSEKAWERMARVVAGKIVNGYCRGDWLLGFLYRSSAAQLSVAGLQPINIQDRRVINVDLSSVVKGHLDYMRQMDTILVAVGVPTKEVPGASFALRQSGTVTKGTVDNPDTTLNEQQVTETQNETAETCTEESGHMTEVADTEEIGDGWDIPDISELLDTLNDTESENLITVRNSLPLSSEENATNNNLSPALNTQQCDDVAESAPDTHPTSAHTHTNKSGQTCKEHVTGPAASL